MVQLVAIWQNRESRDRPSAAQGQSFEWGSRRNGRILNSFCETDTPYSSLRVNGHRRSSTNAVT
jgi:hypothetical protein